MDRGMHDVDDNDGDGWMERGVRGTIQLPNERRLVSGNRDKTGGR
jgi:hypothetical protein